MIRTRAIVVGSGFGGAVAALRLGEARIETIVLERGRRWTVEDPTRNAAFATFRSPDGRSTWLSSRTLAPGYEGTEIDRYPGVLEVLLEDGITILNGAGVGGGSLAYAGVLVQPPKALFERIFPPGVDYDAMDRHYYPRVRDVLKPAPIPDDVLATEYYAAARVMLDQAVAAGFSVSPRSQDSGDHVGRVDLNVDWDVVRAEIAGTKVASAIAGEQWYGNNSGAKLSLDRNYLAQAEATGSVEIRPLHQVTRIAPTEGGGYAVTVDVLDLRGQVRSQAEFACDLLFLAAGSTGTSGLLVRAKAKGTLPNLNASTGTNWGNNGDVFVLRSGLGVTTNPHQGGPASGVAVFNYDNPVCPCVMMPFPSARFATDCPTADALFTGVFVMSTNRGAFRYDPKTDTARLAFPHDTLAEQAARHLADRLTAASGGEVAALSSGITAHPLGGACMGRACDEQGRVFGYSGLYVLDGALMPGSTTCVNPALTIAAFAERSMEAILREDLRES